MVRQSARTVKSCAQDQAEHTFRKVRRMLDEFVKECGGWGKMPEKFAKGGAWYLAEAAIERALNTANATATVDACLEYEQRAERYLNAWRQMNQKAA